MRAFLNIIFVYIPFGCCILVEGLLLLMMYQDEPTTNDLASGAKWAFPFLFLTGIIVHYTKLFKK